MRLRSNSFAILALLAGACAPAGTVATGTPAASRASGSEVRNVVFMVTDGGGVPYWTAADFASAELAVRRMPVGGLVNTRSSSHRITDSAAGASVYATGVRTFNRAIGVGPDCQRMLQGDSAQAKANPAGCDPRESVFALAKRRGMATGVVTTSYVVDATPIAFVAHSPSRYWTDDLAAQMAAADLDVVLGGGRQFFDGSGRKDGRDLLTPWCARATCLRDAAGLAAYRGDDRPLVGLFAPESMGAAEGRSPRLADMAAAALSRLARDRDGFMVVIETEGTDEEGHANRPLPLITREVLEFDRALGVVLDFARANPGTLVVVTADHETGGLTLLEQGDSLAARYSTTGHTAAMVPIFAYGPQAERFGGMHHNYEIGRLLREVVGR